MNILPKKSWHVRNKDNIARVQRDEEKAANEEKERQRRVALAEQEARTDLLRSKARKRSIQGAETSTSITTSEGHINFFEELEDGTYKRGGNKDYEAEKKAEQEKEEKAVGLLTYLGQSAIEAQTSKPWYLEVIHRPHKEDKAVAKPKKEDFEAKKKAALDPLRDMARYIETKSKVSKKDIKPGPHPQRPSSSSSHKASQPAGPKTVEQLRAERLKREKEERIKTELLLAKLSGQKIPSETAEPVVDDRERRYNSQFNPDFVRKPKRRREYSD